MHPEWLTAFGAVGHMGKGGAEGTDTPGGMAGWHIGQSAKHTCLVGGEAGDADAEAGEEAEEAAGGRPHLGGWASTMLEGIATSLRRCTDTKSVLSPSWSLQKWCNSCSMRKGPS